MSYRNNEFKFTCVINRTIPLAKAMNALAHSTTGLVGDLTSTTIDLLDYTNAEQGFTSRISKWPFIVLQAKNSSQLGALRRAADEKFIPNNAFVSTMIGASAQDQIANTHAASGLDLEFWAVCLFGSAEALQPLTKKFSLFTNLSKDEASNA